MLFSFLVLLVLLSLSESGRSVADNGRASGAGSLGGELLMRMRMIMMIMVIMVSMLMMMRVTKMGGELPMRMRMQCTVCKYAHCE